MSLRHDVSDVLQFILEGIEKVQLRLEKGKGSGINDDELDQSIDILKNIWGVADDYKASVPRIVKRRQAASETDPMGPGLSRGGDPGGC